MKTWFWLLPAGVFLVACAAARLASPAPVPATRAVPATPTVTTAARPPPAARRCPTGVATAPEEPPGAWDPLQVERSLWEEIPRFAAETGDGDLVALDCARYPCIGEIAWPGSAVDQAELHAVMNERWPRPLSSQSQSSVDGVVVEHYFVAFHEGAPLSDDVAREIELRRVGFDIESRAAIQEFAAALAEEVEKDPADP